MATITNISNIIRAKKKKKQNKKTKQNKISSSNFPNSFGHKAKPRFEQHSRSMSMINIRGIADKLTKKDDQTQQLIDLSLNNK